LEAGGQPHVLVASAPEKMSPVTYLIGGLVGPRAVLDLGVHRKLSCPYQESNPRPSSQ